MSRANAALFAAILAALLASPEARACRIVEPMPVVRWEQPLGAIETRSHRADVKIKDGVAEVGIEAAFYNPNNVRMEGTYFLPLPAGAEISSFAMTMNGKMVEGELLDAPKAREIYEGIVSRQRDPGLLEYVGEKMLKCRVFPIEPRQDLKIQVAYSQVLERDGRLVRFSYPLRSAKPSGGSIGTLAATVEIESKVPIRTIYSPTHALDVARKEETRARASLEASNVVPDKNLEIYYSLSEDPIGCDVLAAQADEGKGFFLMSLQPSASPSEGDRIPKDLVLVADTSGSMAGDKIRQAREALAFCVNSLDPEDRFNVLTFATETRSFREGLVEATPENVKEARAHIEGIKAMGGTAIDEALQEGLKMLEGKDEARLPMMVFMTDGLPTIGEREIPAIVKRAMEKAGGRIRVFTFGVGYDVNTDLLDRLAAETRGARDYVAPEEEIEVKVSSFYSKVASPILSDVRMEVEGVRLSEVYPRKLPDLFSGGALLIAGRFEGEGKAEVRLTGKVRGEEKTLAFPVTFDAKAGNGFVKRQWARAKVAAALEAIRLNGENPELVEEVRDLGKKYGILTPYTSFLVVEDGALQGPPPPGIFAGEGGDVAWRRLREVAANAPAEFGRGEKKGKEEVERSADLKDALESLGTVGGGGGWGGGSGGGGPGKPGEGGPSSEAIGFAKADRDALSTVANATIRYIGDKTFYLRDGVFVDSAFDEKAHRGKEIILKALSPESFEALKKQPALARFLAEDLDLVVVIEGTAYRIEKAAQK